MLFALALSLPAAARSAEVFGDVEVAWDPNPGSTTAGYKLHYGTRSGIYTEVIDVGLVTEFKIDDLIDRQLYYCAVTAYGPTGLESGYSEELPILFATEEPPPSQGAGLILLEMGSETLKTFEIQNSTDEGTTLRTMSRSVTAIEPVVLEFATAAEANFTAWFRVMTSSSLNDQFTVSLDGSTEVTVHIPTGSLSVPGVPAAEEWVWHRVDFAGPTAAGSHTLRFQASSMDLILDRVVLATNPDFIPSDALPRKGDVISLVRQPQSQTAAPGSSLTLEVEAVATGPLQYQWMKNGLIIPGETDSSLTFPEVEEEDVGSYSVNLWTGSKIVSSQMASVILQKFEVTRMTMGANHTVSFEVSGLQGTTVEVYASADLKDWKLINTLTGVSGTITIADPAAAGEKSRFYQLRTP